MSASAWGGRESASESPIPLNRELLINLAQRSTRKRSPLIPRFNVRQFFFNCLTVAAIIAFLAWLLYSFPTHAEYSVKSLVIAPQRPLNALYSPDGVRSYIMAMSRERGVNPAISDFIVRKESGYDVNTIGDGGISLGAWQFNIKANPQISRACAFDLKCSTDLALRWIADGKIEAWSTWKKRCDWYRNEAPNCP